MDSQKRYLPQKQVTSRYRRSSKTLSRWSDDPEVGFPKPIKIRGYKYFDEAELIDWELRRRSAGTAEADRLQAARCLNLAAYRTAKQHEQA